MSINYEQDLKIDPLEIEKEVLLQPQLVGEYGRLLADARLQAKRADEKKKTVRSDISLDARENPSKVPGGKATDAAVEAYYRNHPDYQDAVDDLLEKERDVELLEIAMQAISQRKSMLENTVRLLLSEWYSTPRIPKEVDSQEFEEKLEAMRERMVNRTGDARRQSRRSA